MSLLTRINSYNPSFHIRDLKQVGYSSELRVQHGTAIKPAILTEVQYKAKYDIKYYTEDLEQFLWVPKRVHGAYRKSEQQCKKKSMNKRKKC